MGTECSAIFFREGNSIYTMSACGRWRTLSCGKSSKTGACLSHILPLSANRMWQLIDKGVLSLSTLSATYFSELPHFSLPFSQRTTTTCSVQRLDEISLFLLCCGSFIINSSADPDANIRGGQIETMWCNLRSS